MSGQAPPNALKLKLVEIGAVLKKAAADPGFAQQLSADPAAAVQTLGYPPPHADEIAFLQNITSHQYANKGTDLAARDPSHTLAEL